MRLANLLAIAFLALSAACACKQQRSDSDAIHDGIVAHLTALKTLNVSAMDIHINSVSIQGNQAQAQVKFVPKAGAPAGAGMQVSYALEKENGNWVVKKTLATGGAIEHPAAGANPHTQLGQANVSDVTSPPMFQDLLHGDNAHASPALPPGHPPVTAASPHTADPNTKP